MPVTAPRPRLPTTTTAGMFGRGVEDGCRVPGHDLGENRDVGVLVLPRGEQVGEPFRFVRQVPAGVGGHRQVDAETVQRGGVHGVDRGHPGAQRGGQLEGEDQRTLGGVRLVETDHDPSCGAVGRRTHRDDGADRAADRLLADRPHQQTGPTAVTRGAEHQHARAPARAQQSLGRFRPGLLQGLDRDLHAGHALGPDLRGLQDRATRLHPGAPEVGVRHVVRWGGLGMDDVQVLVAAHGQPQRPVERRSAVGRRVDGHDNGVPRCLHDHVDRSLLVVMCGRGAGVVSPRR